jgi:hypothetical protein
MMKTRVGARRTGFPGGPDAHRRSGRRARRPRATQRRLFKHKGIGNTSKRSVREGPPLPSRPLILV